ncbi:cytochrome P450 [Rhypophila decipiens]|uniref:Cytochrome P450 n=1 Tax=Rhypophila decipiens TaxID=261697 RepID=A0AAN7BBG9_9PEZI|nr:cytochrome P450 [Rhypophila decipiens]
MALHDSKAVQYAAVAIVVLLLVRALVLSWTRAIRRDGQLLRKPPNTLPLVGNGLKFLQDRWKLFSWFDKCQRQFGYETVSLTVPTLPPGVLIHDPRNLEFVFKNEGIFTKGDFVKGRSWDLFGNGIINADGDMWKTQRKAGLGFLNTANLRVLTDIALPQYLFQSVKYLEAKADGQKVDLQHVFHEITTKLMAKMAYNMEMLADDDFTQSFDHASGCTAERFQNPLWPITEIFFGSRFRRSLSVVKSFGRRIVTNAVEDRKRQQQLEKEPLDETPDDGNSKLDQISGTLIQSLLDALNDEQTVADAALTYLSAGRDTTGQALTWTFYLLSRHPAVVAKIREEVQHAFTENSLSPISEIPADADALPFDTTKFTAQNMPYTMAVFYEVLRLFPPIPFEIRQCTGQSVTLPDGTFLPSGSVLVWCLWAMHRSKLTWGEDADEFRPERFLSYPESGDDKGTVKVINRPPSEFPVFYGGPRTCLGKKMAEAIAVQVIPTMAWLFEFHPAWGTDGKGKEDRKSKSSLTLPMEGGLPVTAEMRKA